MVKITKTGNVGKDMEQGEFPYAAGGSTRVHVLWKTVWYYLLKLMRHITCEVATPLLGIDQVETHTHRQRNKKEKLSQPPYP